MRLETEREDDGRWIAEVPDLPGVLAYAPTRDQAMACAKPLALRVIADRIEHGGVGILSVSSLEGRVAAGKPRRLPRA